MFENSGLILDSGNYSSLSLKKIYKRKGIKRRPSASQTQIGFSLLFKKGCFLPLSCDQERSSLHPYQELRPTMLDPLQPSQNVATIAISNNSQLEGERVICKDFTENTVPWVTIWNQAIFRRDDHIVQICLLTSDMLWCYLQNISHVDFGNI